MVNPYPPVYPPKSYTLTKSFWFWGAVVVLVWVVAEGDSDSVQTPRLRTDQIPSPPVLQSPPTHTYAPPASFRGYRCTNDCSGHEAGYEWGEENGIDDPDDCDGNSESFIEGCRSYAEEQQEELSRSEEIDEY